MSANVMNLTASSAALRSPRVTIGPVGPAQSPLFWFMVIVGVVAALMGLTGAMILEHLRQIATVEITGISESVFPELVLGGLFVAALGVVGLWVRGSHASSR